MAKEIDKIIKSPTPPKDTNVGWWNGKELKFYTNGQWKTSGGSSNNKSFLDVLTLINKPLSVLNIYPLNEERPIEDFGVSEDLLASIYCANNFLEQGHDSIPINTICDNQTGVIYNRGGYLTLWEYGTYELGIYTEDDVFFYDYKLSFDFSNKTGKFIYKK